MYTILESHQEFTDGKLTLVAVLWQSNEAGYVRASISHNKPVAGYHFLKGNEVMSNELLQQVAATGMELRDYLRPAYFPGKRKWE
jgi:hypothetical protein